MTHEARKVINQVQAAGFKAYMRNPEDTWAIMVDGDRLGYIQWDRQGYAKISTMHQPNRTTGTGFALDDIPRLDRENLAKAFIHAPAWANSWDRESVKKWRNLDQFMAASSFNEGYSEVTT